MIARPALVPIAALTALCWTPGAGGDNAPAPQGETLRLTATYSTSVLIFRVGRIDVTAEVANGRYQADAHVEAAGLAALFTDFEIDSEVEGRLDGTAPRPDRYGHVERTGEKVRTVEVGFETGVAQPNAEPPFSSWGQPPASEADRTGTIDPMTAVLFLSQSLAETQGEPCTGSLPVFDGKQRYNLNLTARGTEEIRTRGWRGEALVCDAYYEPISGYDPEDWPEPGETRHPLRLWIAPVGDGAAFIPVRAHTRAGFGGVTIEAREITLG